MGTMATTSQCASAQVPSEHPKSVWGMGTTSPPQRHCSHRDTLWGWQLVLVSRLASKAGCWFQLGRQDAVLGREAGLCLQPQAPMER